VPVEIANTITVPEIVNPLNIVKLTELVNTPGRAAVVVKANTTRLSVPRATMKPGTILNHGDTVLRDGKAYVVTNCKMELKASDVVMRPVPGGKDKIIPTSLPSSRWLKLEVGDVVERYLQDGDYVLLNRQPTLHRNSMQGMKVVIRPGKTMRVNLAIVTGYNLDFDGDEGNIFVQLTLESKAELACVSNAIYNMLSAQSNKPEMVIVQDSLLGAYRMTKERVLMMKKDFDNCWMRIETGFAYTYTERLLQIQKMRDEEGLFSAHALFGFLFPPDFHYKTSSLTIKHGVVLSGFFDKNSLKGGRDSLIRVLCREYNEMVAAKFIDNVQFVTNAFLEVFPFSIGIHDCLIGSKSKKEEIKNTIHKFFLEATNAGRSTDNHLIRESRVNVALNKAKDIGLKIAKEALSFDNNFIDTVASGSKGDYFNIAQITGLLGQQNLNGKRPSPTLTNNTRTLVHYPEVIVDAERKYRSRGFVASSFIEGMFPDEMFFHAMTGREGMTKTAMGTATSGYIQRSIVKINEDLKIAYDGTVRDAKQNVYQFLYGGHGFDPSKVDIFEDTESVFPINFQRLAAQLNLGCVPSEACEGDDRLVFLEETEIEECISACAPPALGCRYTEAQKKQNAALREGLSKVRIRLSQVKKFTDTVVDAYMTRRATPGDAVGIVCAQSIGERQTQTTLDTFHTAGKLVSSGVGRLEELLNMSKKLRFKTCRVYFRKDYATSGDLRTDLGRRGLVCVRFADLYDRHDLKRDQLPTSLTFKLDMKKLFQHRLTPVQICKKLVSLAPHIVSEALFTSKTITTHFKPGCLPDLNDGKVAERELCAELNNLLIAGLPGITKLHLDFDNHFNTWYAITEGSNLRKLLSHPDVDPARLYCNDPWEVYEALGIVGLRKLLMSDLVKTVPGVNSVHLRLLVDKMTFKGKPSSITRYTMRNNEVGPLSKATFEESIDILISAAMHTEKETMQGVSAAIIAGNQAPVGTGSFDLHVDFKKLVGPDSPSISPQIYKPSSDLWDTS
jgi:DNA-directed RNA polymerase beta' subunit